MHAAILFQLASQPELHGCLVGHLLAGASINKTPALGVPKAVVAYRYKCHASSPAMNFQQLVCEHSTTKTLAKCDIDVQAMKEHQLASLYSECTIRCVHCVLLVYSQFPKVYSQLGLLLHQPKLARTPKGAAQQFFFIIQNLTATIVTSRVRNASQECQISHSRIVSFVEAGKQYPLQQRPG